MEKDFYCRFETEAPGLCDLCTKWTGATRILFFALEAGKPIATGNAIYARQSGLAGELIDGR